MTNLQVMVGVAQLKINFLLKKRKKFFIITIDYLKMIVSLRLLPKKNDWSTNSCWFYTIFISNIGEKRRDKLMKILNSKGVETRPGFYPLHSMKPYKKYGKGLHIQYQQNWD